MYATVADMRFEGVTAAQASDERLSSLLAEATSYIDQATGWFFDVRQWAFLLSGCDTPTVELPVPPIRVDFLAVDGYGLSTDKRDLIVVGAPVAAPFECPRLTLKHGIFPAGRSNVEVDGLWGYTEPDGTAEGRTPLAIRRACMLLVLRWLYPLADEDLAGDARNRWRILEERTRDQSFKLAGIGQTGAFTGDPEIDNILWRYMRPIGLGAV